MVSNFEIQPGYYDQVLQAVFEFYSKFPFTVLFCETASYVSVQYDATHKRMKIRINLPGYYVNGRTSQLLSQNVGTCVAPAVSSSRIAFHRFGLLLIIFPLQSAQCQYLSWFCGPITRIMQIRFLHTEEKNISPFRHCFRSRPIYQSFHVSDGIAAQNKTRRLPST